MLTGSSVGHTSVMETFYLRAAALLLLLLAPDGAHTTDTCSEPRATRLSFSVTSRRNQTGHWVVTANLSSWERQGVWKRAKDVTLDVDHGTSVCAGTDAVQMGATATFHGTAPAPGYELFPGLGYYKMFTSASDWEAARATCAAQTGHLLVLDSDAEAVVVNEFFGRRLKLQNADHEVYVFVGIHDRYTEGKWLAVTGQPVAELGYPNWHSSQHDGGVAENCGVVVKGSMQYADAPCSWKLGFICEYVSH